MAAADVKEAALATRRPRTMARFVDEIATAVDTKFAKTRGDDVVRRKLNTVLDACGWERQSAKRMAALHEALQTIGINTLPDISDGHRSPEAWIRFSRQEIHRPLGHIFGSEAGVSRFIKKYHTSVFDRVPGLEDLEFIGHEVKLSADLRADMMFRKPNGERVIVEFKRGDPTVGVATKLRMYMDACRLRYDTHASGIIITAKPQTQVLEDAIRREIANHQLDYPIAWYWYSVKVHLEPA